MDIDIKQFQHVFIDECREGLEIMEAELLNLSPGAVDSEIINTIFRVAHSIKGGAGTFGFSQLTEFTHDAETLLDDIRAGKRAFIREYVALLLQTVDCLREWIDLLESGSALSPPSAAALKLQFKQFLLAEVMPNDSERLGWRINFFPGRDILKQGNEPGLIFSQLQNMGELTVTPQFEKLPELCHLSPQELYLSWRLELVGNIDIALIKEVFEWVEDDSVVDINSLRKVAVNVNDQANLNAKSIVTAKSPELTVANKSSETSSIRVSIDKVDSLINMVGELVITQAMLREIGNDFSLAKLPALKEGLLQLSQHTREMQDSVMKIRMLPIRFALNRIPRMVRDLSAQLNKNVTLRMHGEETELDKIMLEKLSEPIIHLVRNALDHGIETVNERLRLGKPKMAFLDINAFHQGGEIFVEIKDDGDGLNRSKIYAKAVEKGIVASNQHLSDERIDELIFSPGFSTVDSISDISGRGVGMDVVKRNIESLGGDIKVKSKQGEGCCFSIRLPLTLSIMDGQLVKIGTQTYILPIMSIIESLQLQDGMVAKLADRTEVFKLRDEFIPIIRLHELLDHTPISSKVTDGLLVVVESHEGKYGLLVDDLAAQQQVVIKNLEDNFIKVNCVSGATILGNGTVALILDITDVVKQVTQDKYQQQDKDGYVAA